MWLYLCIASAMVLGIYDVFKKSAVKDNAPLLVLFFSVCAGAAVTLPVFLLSRLAPEAAARIGLWCEVLPPQAHLLVLVKAVLVSISWISAFFALKHLPISIVTPIRASAPLWTLFGAVFLFGERPTPLQWGGIAIILGSYSAFSLIGKKEGIIFTKNRWILLVFLATVSGAASALYDKHLLRNAGIDPVTLQVWFSFYLVAVLGMTVLTVRRGFRIRTAKLEPRASIIFVGVLLIVADFLYFRALSMDGALIAVISTVRRSSVIVSFTVGGLWFREKNKREKALPLAGVLIGVTLLVVKTL